jgi:hypothetical protein
MPHIRSQRRSLALAAGSLLLAAQLSACGFNNATDEIYQASAGVDYRQGQLDVLSAVVVSEQKGSGTFIATFSNNSVKEPTTVQGIAAGTDDAPEGSPVEISGFTPIEVPPGGFVNLANDPSTVVRGDFFAGEYVALKISFDNRDAVEMSVPVVAAANQYEGLDVSGAAVESTAPVSPSESVSQPASESPSE